MELCKNPHFFCQEFILNPILFYSGLAVAVRRDVAILKRKRDGAVRERRSADAAQTAAQL